MYPALHLVQIVDIVTVIFQQEVKPVIYIKRVNKFTITLISSTDFNWEYQDHINIKLSTKM